jgi:hypothetical protein
MNVIALAPKLTADEEVKASVVNILKKALEEAESGQIISVVVLLGCVNGDWCNRASETINFSSCIGQLEITKHELIKQFLTTDVLV